MSGYLMPCLETICMALFNDVNLHLIFYPITSSAWYLQIFTFPPLCNAFVWQWPIAEIAGALAQSLFLFSIAFA